MQQVAVEGMADILPPLQPANSNYLMPGLLLAAAVVIIALWFWRQRRPRAKLRRLKILARHYQAGQLDTRQTAVQLRHEIKQGFHLSHIHQLHPPTNVDRLDWQCDMQTLQAACFSTHHAADIDLVPVINNTQQWLLQHAE